MNDKEIEIKTDNIKETLLKVAEISEYLDTVKIVITAKNPKQGKGK